MKWNNILINDASKLTIEQINIIKSIQEFVNQTTVERLFNHPYIGEKYMNENLSKFQTHFTNDELYLLIECAYFTNDFSIKKSSEYLSTLSEANNTHSSTSNSSTTRNCNCYYSISCGIFMGTCDTGNCKKITECGIMGSSNCNGICSTTPVEVD